LRLLRIPSQPGRLRFISMLVRDCEDPSDTVAFQGSCRPPYAICIGLYDHEGRAGDSAFISPAVANCRNRVG